MTNPFDDLKAPADAFPAGYRAFSVYPAAYQAVEFPAYGNEIRLTGNDLAHFFAAGVKDAATGQVVDVKANSENLRKLIDTILAQGPAAADRPLVRLQIDADVFENPQRFVEKYQALRSEPDQAERERLLAQEAAIIVNFVQNGGIPELVKNALRTQSAQSNPPLTDQELEDESREFLNQNFRLEGVRTAEALCFATWEIKSSEGVFVARQEYRTSTYMVNRPWQLGMEKHLIHMAENDHTGAQQVLQAIQHTRTLEYVDLTLGATSTRGNNARSNISPLGPGGTC